LKNDVAFWLLLVPGLCPLVLHERVAQVAKKIIQLPFSKRSSLRYHLSIPGIEPGVTRLEIKNGTTTPNGHIGLQFSPNNI
jgi:hypothetical protein